MSAGDGRREPSTEELEALRRAGKETLRRTLRAVRSKLPPEAVARRSALVAALVQALPEWASARTISAYAAMRGEIDPAPLVAAAHGAGKTVALPRVEPGSADMTLRRVAEGDTLEPTRLGFAQPGADAAVVPGDAVDLVLVPCLAVDPRGHRVGWGKGYYDRLLASRQGACAVCLAHDFQLVPEVPEVPGDVPVDVVVTNRETLRAREGGAA